MTTTQTPNGSPDSSSKGSVWLRRLYQLGAVILVWTTSFFLISQSESGNLKDTSLLLGAASLALFVFSIAIAVLAIFGWQGLLTFLREEAGKAADVKAKEAGDQLEEGFRKDVAGKLQLLETSRIGPMEAARLKLEEDLRDIKERLENEVRGRAFSILGFVTGEASLDPDTLDPRNERDKENLLEAIRLCEQGYDYLKKVGIGPEFLGLNNLVYYSCAYGFSEDKPRRKSLVVKARSLLEAGEKHRAANLVLTGCRTILALGTDPDEKDQALSALRAFDENQSLSGREKRERETYLKRYSPGSPDEPQG